MKSRPPSTSLQAPALQLAQRLGTRYANGKLGRSLLEGVLTVGLESRTVRIERRQNETVGEEVEITFDGPGKQQTWVGHSGAMVPIAQTPGADRELIEHLVADSPDQFVLAQTRGASYSTVARTVRTGDQTDGYEGPLWEVVRVDEPRRDNTGKPENIWRLYYLNLRTGLIDRVVSQSRGETIEALLEWSNYSDELVPARISWTEGARTIMEFRLTHFSHAEQ